jgi:hypothetical protein
MNLNKLARNAGMVGGCDYAPLTNEWMHSQGLQKQYFTQPTQANAVDVGDLADNVFNTACQGVDTSKDWYEYTPIQIRSTFASSSATGELQPDDWQRIYIIQPAGLTYIPIGSYMQYANNWWIVYKPNNMGLGIGQAVVRRCNAVINVLDYYGNVISIPMSYAKMGTLGNASHATENSITAKNYISCVCQLNKYSKAFVENTRLLLGNMSYAMRGVNNFTREFTNKADSVHIITFTIEMTEPLPQDDFERGVADGLAFKWLLSITADKSMNAGATQTIAVKSIRNGESVVSTAENPITYVFTSSDTNVLTVDENGLVKAVGEGSATVTVTLAQNPDITQTVDITVAAAGDGYVAFTSTPLTALHSLETAEISAAWFENGTATDDVVTFSFSGADEDAYSADVSGNTATLTCYSLSDKPLIVTAAHGDSTTQMSIELLD